MPRKRLTAAFVSSAKPPASGRIDYFDTWSPRPGITFGLRVGKRSKTFCIFYRPEGGQWQRHVLGRFDPQSFNLADAHDEAVRKARELVDGGDPAADHRERKGAPTFAKVADRYIEEWARPRKKSWQLDRQYLDRDVKPRWGRRRIGDIRRRDVRELVAEIEGRGAPVLANRTLAVVRKLFRWAAQNDVPGVESDPTFGVELRPGEKARAREYTDAEIRALWSAYGDLPAPSRDALRLVAVTAQRSGEVMRMRAVDIDTERRTWTIPASDSKSGRPQLVPLTDLAWSIVEPRLAKTPSGTNAERGFLFPSPRGGGDRPIQTLQKAQETAREAAGIEDARIHDWRRTATTRMARAGVASFTLARVLNHAQGTVTGRHYDVYDYLAEKRDALERWEQELRRIIDAECD